MKAHHEAKEKRQDEKDKRTKAEDKEQMQSLQNSNASKVFGDEKDATVKPRSTKAVFVATNLKINVAKAGIQNKKPWKPVVCKPKAPQAPHMSNKKRKRLPQKLLL
jgi:hypothetical protein